MSPLVNPTCTYPDKEEWLKVIAEAKLGYKLPEKEHHMVLYTDGGCRPSSRGTPGWGLHGYLYIENVPKQGHGCKGFLPTSRGYENLVGDNQSSIKERTVSVLHYLNGFGVIAGIGTNNVAELHAFYHALQLAMVAKPKTLLIKTDSEYVAKGINEYLEIWKSANWTRPNGGELANLTLWKNVDRLFSDLKTVIEDINVLWVKGHKDSIGNNKADELATEACNAGLNGYVIHNVSIIPYKEYWKNENNYNRLLAEKYWYFTTNSSSHIVDDYTVYHLGNHGDEVALFGKAISDATFSVIFTKSPDPVLEAIRKAQNNLQRNVTGVITLADLNIIFKPAVYSKILQTVDCHHLYRDKYSLVLTTPADLEVTHELREPGLGYSGVDQLNQLQNKMLDFLRGDCKDHVITSLDDFIYETVETKEGDTLSVKFPQGAMDAVITVLAGFVDSQGTYKTRNVKLVVGLDLPKRQTLAAIVSREPRIFLITWPEVSECHAFRYACIIQTIDGDMGIWSTPYSNLSMCVNGIT